MLKLFAALTVAALGSSACAHTARYVTAEHWHDSDSFFVAYTEYTKTNFIVATGGSSTAHVILCRAAADNTAQCRPQAAVDRLLNPGADIPEPPPAAPASPSPAEPAPSEPPPAPPAPPAAL